MCEVKGYMETVFSAQFFFKLKTAPKQSINLKNTTILENI